MSKAVAIIDYGSGNLFSVARALEHCGAEPFLTAEPAAIRAADRVVLPGVGAFAAGMQGLRERGLVEAVRRYAESDRPLLGICLGMQMLASESEEFGQHEGLAIIPGRVVHIPRTDVDGNSQKIPHIGWSAIFATWAGRWRGTILETSPEGTSYYLVHSYHFVPNDPRHVVAECEYGGHRLTAVVQSGSTIGCQFHPEKSGAAGLSLLTAFLSA